MMKLVLSISSQTKVNKCMLVLALVLAVWSMYHFKRIRRKSNNSSHSLRTLLLVANLSRRLNSTNRQEFGANLNLRFSAAACKRWDNHKYNLRCFNQFHKDCLRFQLVFYPSRYLRKYLKYQLRYCLKVINLRQQPLKHHLKTLLDPKLQSFKLSII